MTAAASTVEATVAKLTANEAKILALFASGETLDLISQKTSTKRAEVDHIVMEIANFNVGHARELAVTWQRKNNPGLIGSAPTPEVEGPSLPTIAKGQLAKTPVEPIANLINRAVASKVPKLIRLADRIQDLVDDLEAQLKDHDRGAALRTEQKQLEQRLAEIRRELGGSAPAAGKSTAADNKAVREWARSNGVACPERGKIPRAVFEAYVKASA